MNFYEHHLGDYARDAGHLSFIEDAAYRRLIDAYYAREKPLPPDIKECQKLARCTTAAERKAVSYVLGTFFRRQDDGYHQKRCDEEIADYLEGEPDREVKKENGRERQRRARARRRELYEALRSHGIVPDFDATTKELESRLSRVTSGNGHSNVTRDAVKDVTRDERVTTRLPVPSPQSPVPSPQDSESASETSSVSVRASPSLGTGNSRANGAEEDEKFDERHHHAQFELVKAAYPKRAGREDWLQAEHACRLRLDEGETWEGLLAAARRYAAHIRAKNDEGTQFVMAPGKFFSAADRPWVQPWPQPTTKVEQRTDANLNAAAEAKRRLFGNST